MSTNADLPNMRVSYNKGELSESDLAETPLAQFQNWLAEAVAVGSEVVAEPNAMVLSTASSAGVISTRTVLLKAIDSRGLTFYTNYGSRKAEQIAAHEQVTALFPWYPLHRQIIVSGTASKVSREEASEYWKTRPHLSQLGAMASAQSSRIDSREVIEEAMSDLQQRFPDEVEVPLPENWGGFLITVENMEFWQGRRSRLHDRLRFESQGAHDLNTASDWKVQRYSP